VCVCVVYVCYIEKKEKKETSVIKKELTFANIKSY
jgi:hypothetical protein